MNDLNAKIDAIMDKYMRLAKIEIQLLIRKEITDAIKKMYGDK